MENPAFIMSNEKRVYIKKFHPLIEKSYRYNIQFLHIFCIFFPGNNGGMFDSIKTDFKCFNGNSVNYSCCNLLFLFENVQINMDQFTGEI